MQLVPYLAARAEAARMDREGERLAWPLLWLLRTLAWCWLGCLVVFVGGIGYLFLCAFVLDPLFSGK